MVLGDGDDDQNAGLGETRMCRKDLWATRRLGNIRKYVLNAGGGGGGDPSWVAINGFLQTGLAWESWGVNPLA